MSVMQKENDGVVRTTLYLTKANKEWLNRQPRGQRTNLVNKAIGYIQQAKDIDVNKKVLLEMLDALPLYKTNGKNINETLQEGRNRK